MKVAVASGKGGTGKTSVALALAQWLATHRAEGGGGEVTLVDADVEEPNVHIFLGAALQETRPVLLPIPEGVPELCNGCGKCLEVCQFNALAVVQGKVMVFPELCHSCGACVRVCPTTALREVERRVGSLQEGDEGKLHVVEGRLEVGSSAAPEVIRRAKQRADEMGGDQVIDSPPGTACAMVAAVRGADFVVLVTEPTPFGLHDLKLAVKSVRYLGLPHGVLVNRDGIGDERVEHWCAAERISLLGKIPQERAIAEGHARGVPLLECSEAAKKVIDRVGRMIFDEEEQ